MRNKVSIYTTHYKFDETIPSSCITPIHVGKSNSDNVFYDMDDAYNKNISDKNSTFCELTAHYWVWKNKLDSEYIGFMHHRRHLCFNDNNSDKKNPWGLISYPEINDDYVTKCGLDEASIQLAINDNDILVAEKWDVRITGNENNYELYKNTDFLHIEDYDLALSILIERHPEYEKYVEEYNNSHWGYYTNIFIMRKDIFDNYANWIFPILFELEDKINFSNYSPSEKRVIGHIAERLVGIFILKASLDGNYKIKELQRTIVESTEPKIQQCALGNINFKAVPSYDINDESYVPIVVNFNEAYAHVAAACLQSIISCASKEFNYEIFILGNKVSAKSLSRYNDMVNEYRNITVIYIEINNLIAIESFRSSQYFSAETYFRLFIPKIFSNFYKVIYLDVDMIVNKDLSNLMSIELNNSSIAAVQCYVMQSFIENKISSSLETGALEAGEYLKNVLKLNNSKYYIQAGLIVFNIKKLNESNFVNRAIDELKNNYWFLDQDIINKILDCDVKLLPYNWNVLHGNNNVDALTDLLPQKIKMKYIEARDNPYIVHYAGPEKPWNNRHVEFADLYWKNIMQTVWFSDFVFDTMYKSNINIPFLTVTKKTNFNPICGTKFLIRKLFDKIFPINSKRRIVFARYYKRFRRLNK